MPKYIKVLDPLVEWMLQKCKSTHKKYNLSFPGVLQSMNTTEDAAETFNLKSIINTLAATSAGIMEGIVDFLG